MGYIGAHGVAALKRYKYSGVDHSYVAKYILQPFWTRFVTFFPLWMPPNMITLTGLIFLLASALLGYVYSPQLDSPPPRWVHFAHGLLLFLYQTFDAVDGKQARRTSSSSPLGELFDHGCDALVCAFEALAFGSTCMCGRNAFWFWVIAAVPFYCATWEHFFTNTLILPVINGPTEGLMLIYLAHFFTTFVGAEWWAQPLGKSSPFFSWVPFFSGILVHEAVLYFMIAFAVIPTVGFKLVIFHKPQSCYSFYLIELASGSKCDHINRLINGLIVHVGTNCGTIVFHMKKKTIYEVTEYTRGCVWVLRSTLTPKEV